ncbi:SRPBCC family protein [Nevskia ramosa]|uniref:SRPBCC family protein n=1 Tax=Nevskia ramosa TaxID=64002 RepID=UPI00048CE6F6|nr:SRPBCC family protein [Nevskia ramosa]
MLKAWTPLFVACALLPGAVLAHGPSRLKVVESVEIAAPVDKVWARLSKFDDASWIPAVAKTDAKGGNEVGATRTVTLKAEGSPTIEEELVKYNAEGKSLSYKITKVDPKVLPVNNYASTITVSGDATKSTVEWKAGFYRGYPNNDPPPELNDDASQAAVTKLYETTLAELKKSLEGGK